MKSVNSVIPLCVTAFILLATSPAQASVYNVNLDGATIDLSGFIDTSALGTFSLTEFDALLNDYSITASQNGSYAHTFNLADSTWGGFYGGEWYGANISINISTSEIVLMAPTGGDYDAGNLFLLANTVTNGALENLRFANDQLGYRTPNPPDAVIFETVPTSFVLATANSPVPLPAAAWLFGSGLLGLIGVARRKAA